MSNKWTIPFSEEQIRILNDYQENGDVHPYTCGVCSSKKIAKIDGLWCMHCHTRQNWSHNHDLGLNND